MLKRKAAFIASFIVVLVLSCLLSSCTPTLPSRKPDFTEILTKYSTTENKMASAKVTIDFGASFNLNIDGFDGDYTIKFAQVGDITRVANGGKIAADFDIYTGADDNKNSELSLIIFVLENKGLADLADIIRCYFHQKTTQASLLFGYDGQDSYNIKTGYYPKDGDREYNKFYAVNQDTLNMYQEALELRDYQIISLKSGLMTSDFLSIEKHPSFMANENAPLRYNEASKAYLYSFVLDNAQLKEQLLEMFEIKVLPYLAIMNQDDIFDIYKQFEKSIKGWFNITSTSVQAKADEDGRLSAMTTSIKLSLQIPNKDLKNVVNMVLPGKGEEIGSLISNIKIDIDVKVEEEYAYEGLGLYLDKYNAENIFESTTNDVKGREVLQFIDWRASTNGSEMGADIE